MPGKRIWLKLPLEKMWLKADAGSVPKKMMAVSISGMAVKQDQPDELMKQKRAIVKIKKTSRWLRQMSVARSVFKCEPVANAAANRVTVGARMGRALPEQGKERQAPPRVDHQRVLRRRLVRRPIAEATAAPKGKTAAVWPHPRPPHPVREYFSFT